MITNLRQAQEELGKPCAFLMDIAGPKLRLGPIEAGPRLLEKRTEALLGPKPAGRNVRISCSQQIVSRLTVVTM
jgi:pyruvate kinase